MSPAYGQVTTLPINKCLAGKIQVVGKSLAARTKCVSKGVASGTSSAECLAKAAARFTGGADPSKGAFEKLEAKYPAGSVGACLTFDDQAILDSELADVTTSIAATTGTAVGDCDATKIKCVGKYLAAIAKCQAKAAGDTGSIDGECTAKAQDKLANPATGCLAKAAAAGACSNAGSQATALQAVADAVADDAASTLAPSAATPTASVSATGTASASATPTASASATPTASASATATDSPTQEATQTATDTPVPTPSETATASPTTSATSSPTATVVITPPSVTSAAPSSRGRGASNRNVTVNGSGFVVGAVVSFSAAGITVHSTTFVSATQLTANVSISPTATLGAGNIVVTNPDTGVGTGIGIFTVNPAPTVTSSSPSARVQPSGSSYFLPVTIYGTGFVGTPTLSYSCNDLSASVTTVTSTYFFATVTIPPSVPIGPCDIVVTNPDGGVGTLGNGFRINAPPTLSSVIPNGISTLGGTPNLNVYGTGFQSGANVSISGGFGSTSFVSSGWLTASFMFSSGQSTGTKNVTVTNPDGGTVSAPLFTVNPLPAVNSVNPTSMGQGASNKNLLIQGSGFATTNTNGLTGHPTVSFSGGGITVNSDFASYSSGTISISISISPTATTGAQTMTITNPDGGWVSSSLFTVNAGPTVTSTSPSSLARGATGQTVTLYGSNFAFGRTVSFSGTGVSVDSIVQVSSTQLTLTVSVAADATLGARSITVTNMDFGVGTGSNVFTVN